MWVSKQTWNAEKLEVTKIWNINIVYFVPYLGCIFWKLEDHYLQFDTLLYTSILSALLCYLKPSAAYNICCCQSACYFYSPAIWLETSVKSMQCKSGFEWVVMICKSCYTTYTVSEISTCATVVFAHTFFLRRPQKGSNEKLQYKGNEVTLRMTHKYTGLQLSDPV